MYVTNIAAMQHATIPVKPGAAPEACLCLVRHCACMCTAVTFTSGPLRIWSLQSCFAMTCT